MSQSYSSYSTEKQQDTSVQRTSFSSWEKSHQQLADNLRMWGESFGTGDPNTPDNPFLESMADLIDRHRPLSPKQADAAEDAFADWYKKLTGGQKPDLDGVPSGWDPLVWDLALLFEQCAEKKGIQLAAGRPVIYAKLEHRINESGIRESPDSVRRDSKGSIRPWQDLVRAAIFEFWTASLEEQMFSTGLWDQYSLDDFTKFTTFRDMCQTVRKRAAARRSEAKCS